MEKELSIEEIMANYEAAQKETTNNLKKLLQQRTQEILGLLGLEPFQAHIKKVFDYVELEVDDLLLDGGTLEQGQTEVGYGATHAVLRPDGKLYHLRVFGEPDDEDGDWEYSGTLQGEITPEEYLKIAPDVIRRVEEGILEASKS
jgi:hypothetical protein